MPTMWKRPPDGDINVAKPGIGFHTSSNDEDGNVPGERNRWNTTTTLTSKKPKYNQQEQIGFPHKGQEQVTLQQSIKVKVHNPQCQAHQATPGHRQQQRHYGKPEHRTPITGELG
ncbi:hypothetical protein HPB52_010165 [Rhipicephalus sanguineus]|uniref:Uncharacterized protein n=1 Tax=Rhipicephalus sanguineus TaxID=34632 RepID=A0A9D4SYK7_RHISA|nr:hypothetical protein HPB52_010165 [Rhipicephalus sanguineus]